MLLRTTGLTSLISVMKNQIVYIYAESWVTAADSVPSSFNTGIISESHVQQVQPTLEKIMRGMYHYSNTGGKKLCSYNIDGILKTDT